jgi:hypothetical protein
MAEGGEPARAIQLLRSLSTPESSLSRLAGERGRSGWIRSLAVSFSERSCAAACGS